MEKEYAGHYKDIYLRDPQGNVMAVYRIRKDSLFLTELPIYGEKRLGVIKENRFLMKKPTQNGIATPMTVTASKPLVKTSIYTLGKKHFESTDRLGNVRVTYTDKKSWQQNKFVLNVSSSQDYYPFGSVMEGRKYNLTAYRYGFNTQERVPELNESHYTALYWEYDGRLARRWNRDPVLKDHESPYAVFVNNPVILTDWKGLDTSFVDKEGNYDIQAKKDFMKAYNTVNDKISDLNKNLKMVQEELSKEDLKKRHRKKLEKDKLQLERSIKNWIELKSDFENIINSPIVFIYSSDATRLKENELGSIGEKGYRVYDEFGNIIGGEVTIIMRPGHDEAVIHENRHANQIIRKADHHMPLLELEKDAFLAQKIYNPTSVERFIKNALQKYIYEMGIPPNLTPNWNLEEAIKYEYGINEN